MYVYRHFVPCVLLGNIDKQCFVDTFIRVLSYQCVYSHSIPSEYAPISLRSFKTRAEFLESSLTHGLLLLSCDIVPS